MSDSSTENSFVEQRIIFLLFGYWEKLRRDLGKLLPSESDIDPDDIEGLWDYCFLVQTRDMQKDDYNYTYLGSAILEAYKAGLSQDNPCGLVSPNANRLALNYSRLLETKQPILEDGEFRNVRNQLVKYRQCLLPLGYRDEVDAIFGGMRFRIFD